jgi:hypothetical protein
MTDKHGHQSLYPEGRFKLCLLNPLARFSNGNYYQDFFGERLARTLADYEFDGFQGADGYKCLIKTLEHADYSENIISQFEERFGQTVPGPPRSFRGKPVEFKANFIWKHHRTDWIEFYCQRWAEFWKTVVGHTDGKGTCVNSAWNMSPADAIARYGIDYRRLYDSGIREVYHEAGCAGGWSYYGSYAGPDSEKPGGWLIPWEEMFLEVMSRSPLKFKRRPDSPPTLYARFTDTSTLGLRATVSDGIVRYPFTRRKFFSA